MTYLDDNHLRAIDAAAAKRVDREEFMKHHPEYATLTPRVIAMDDWLIYADVGGKIVFTASEVWPEWLDYPTAPEDMPDEDFKRATLEILKHKRPKWDDFVQWMVDGERSDAAKRGRTFDAAQAAVDAEFYVAEIRELAAKQAAFIEQAAGSAT